MAGGKVDLYGDMDDTTDMVDFGLSEDDEDLALFGDDKPAPKASKATPKAEAVPVKEAEDKPEAKAKAAAPTSDKSDSKEETAAPAETKELPANATPSALLASFDDDDSKSDQVQIWVGNLPWWTTDTEIEELLGTYGTIASMKIFTDTRNGKFKGFLLADYDTADSALAAKKALHGQKVNGNEIVVDFASNRQEGKRKSEAKAGKTNADSAEQPRSKRRNKRKRKPAGGRFSGPPGGPPPPGYRGPPGRMAPNVPPAPMYGHNMPPPRYGGSGGYYEDYREGPMDGRGMKFGGGPDGRVDEGPAVGRKRPVRENDFGPHKERERDRVRHRDNNRERLEGGRDGRGDDRARGGDWDRRDKDDRRRRDRHDRRGDGERRGDRGRGDKERGGKGDGHAAMMDREKEKARSLQRLRDQADQERDGRGRRSRGREDSGKGTTRFVVNNDVPNGSSGGSSDAGGDRRRVVRRRR